MAEDFSPWSLISSPVTGAFQYAGGKAQADAAKYGADKQAQSIQAALDYTKDLKGKQETAYAPYAALGAQSLSGLARSVRPSPTSGAPLPYTTQPMATQAQPMAPQGQPMSAMAPPQGQMVTLRAPDGSTRQFPTGDPRIQQALQKGAVQA